MLSAAKNLMERRNGFTLVELLVVMTIIGILLALLLPAVQAARESARVIKCANNLKQIGLALHGYHAALRSFPPGNINLGAGLCPGAAEPTVSYSSGWGTWMIAILPYLEQNALYAQYDTQYLNDAPQNQAVCQTTVPAYACPADDAIGVLGVPATGPASVSGARYAPGSYRAVTGCSRDGLNFLDSEMMFDYQRPWRGAVHAIYTSFAWGFNVERLSDITDGTSQTLMVGESTTATEPSRRTFWAYSFAYYAQSGATAQQRTVLGDFDDCVNAGGVGNEIPCKREWGSFHPGGMNFALCDGSVRLLHTNIDLNLFENLATIAGGEPGVSPPD
jgi:prepilin-type N-terminal cleavage/methylation domain-containing protein/prepilin-type processing-associated H-X9-DG protein